MHVAITVIPDSTDEDQCISIDIYGHVLHFDGNVQRLACRAISASFYGAIAVSSVTRCRCCRCRCRRGHRCAGGVRQWRRATVATPGEWQCGVRRLAVANGPNIFQILLVETDRTICLLMCN